MNIYKKLVYVLMVWILILLFAIPSTSPINARVALPLEEGLQNYAQTNWWATVQENIRKSEYHITWQEITYLADVPAAYQAPNRAQNLRSYFTSKGLIVIPRVWRGEAKNPPWRWEVQLIAWGRGQDLQPVLPARLKVQDNLIEYLHGGPYTGRGLVEWYYNDENSLDQGFTLFSPPGGEPTGEPLQIDQVIDGALSPQMTRDGTDIEFYSHDGRAVLRYGAPTAVDAAGEELPAWLAMDGNRLSLYVDDAAAVYPITIDPLINGLPPDYDWVQSGGGPTSQFGFSVATAGDVNGDGYSDVIVGAPYYDGGKVDEGRAEVYPGWVYGLENVPIWTKNSNQESAEFGYSVATAGDVNGDGYADIIVGAPQYDNGQEDEGAAWIYHGSDDGPHSAPDNFDEGNQINAEFGYSVASAGDVNGDGYADIIVGAPFYTSGETSEGRVWIWHGSSSGVSELHDWRAESDQSYAAFGCSVSTAGDVNGDGYADIIVGGWNYNNGQSGEGIAMVWHGSQNGINEGVNGNPTNEDWLVDSNQENANLGLSVSTAGDVNGDGFADVIVGAHQYTNGQAHEGAAWVYHGSATGLNTSWANMDEGNQAEAWFGYRVATAGDVNGDGFADVIVGAPLYTSNTLEEGRAWVWHGSTSGISETRDWYADGENQEAWYGTSVATAGDVNADGYSDIVIGAPGDLSQWGSAYAYYGSASSLNETAGWTKVSNKAQALFGFSVGTAGDVNADGYADVIVGAPRWDGGQALEGGAWVYHGKDGGLNSAPAWDKFSDKVNAQFGWSVGTAGDVNGDGYSDVIVGSPTWNNGQAEEGMVFVYEGGVSGLSAPPAWSKDSDQVGAQFGWSVGTAGDVNGDGYSDIVVGSPFWDGPTVEEEDEGKAWVYLGFEGGLISAPHWHTDIDQKNAQYGYSVGTAGDVNRDGYSDVIVGAPLWDHGQVNEGGAWVYFGSSSGLDTTLDWRQDSDVALAQYGFSVGTAGDVNGDGYADIIVGAPMWSQGHTNEGRAFVYHGTSSGLYLVEDWYKESNQGGARFGTSVGTAGDVNGDGYADIIVGADLWTNGMNFEGGAWVYHGAHAGTQSAPDWHAEGEQISAHFGASVGTAGDVNGDGYAEVIVGAPNYNTNPEKADEGQARVYFGNGGPGVSLRLYQFNPDGVPLAQLGHSNKNSFRIGALQTNPFGRGEQLFEIESKPLNQRFNGSNTFIPGGSQSWFNPILGTGTTMSSGQLIPDMPYHWRLRTIYNPGTTPFMPASRWITIPWNGWNEQDFRTGGGRIFLPLILK